MTEAAPPVYFAVFHRPGPLWEQGVSFREQTHVGTHVGYMSQQAEQGRIVLGGPFLDEESGGLMVMRAESLDEANTIAQNDPSVQIGFLTAHVRPWLAAMSSE